MKGYFSQLALSTGISPGGSGDANASAAARIAGGRPEGREQMAPLEIAAVSFTTPSEPANPTGFASNSDVDATAPTAATSATSTASPGRSPADVSDVKPGNANAAATSTEVTPRISFAGVQTRFVDAATSAGDLQPGPTDRADRRDAPPERSPAGVRRIVPSSGDAASLDQTSEGPSLQTRNAGSDRAPRLEADTIVELPSQTTAAEPRIQFTYSDSTTPATQSEQSPRGPQIEFSSGASPAAEWPAESLERVEIFERPSATLRQPRDLTDQVEPETAGQAATQSREGSRGELVRTERSSPEAVVRNYMKEVRAWVAGAPTQDESAPELSDWLEAPQARRDVFAFEHERDATAFPHQQSAEPQVQDVSLSIGNISVVIEEPQSNAPAPIAAPPAAERSHGRTDREPTSLSRYYLSPW